LHAFKLFHEQFVKLLTPQSLSSLSSLCRRQNSSSRGDLALLWALTGGGKGLGGLGESAQVLERAAFEKPALQRTSDDQDD